MNPRDLADVLRPFVGHIELLASSLPAGHPERDVFGLCDLCNENIMWPDLRCACPDTQEKK